MFNLTFEDFRRIIGQQEIEKYLTAKERDTAVESLNAANKEIITLKKEIETLKDQAK